MGNIKGNKRGVYKIRGPNPYPTTVCFECGETYCYSSINHAKYNMIHKRWVINNTSLII